MSRRRSRAPPGGRLTQREGSTGAGMPAAGDANARAITTARKEGGRGGKIGRATRRERLGSLVVAAGAGNRTAGGEPSERGAAEQAGQPPAAATHEPSRPPARSGA